MSRRLVVVLFVDLVGWTGLGESVDPEPLQHLLDRYYEICSTAVDDHGGVVEKFIGDAVMAVFGATTARENDALRALRAAFRIHTDVAALRLPGAGADRVRVHCGAAAGEALVTHSTRAGLRVVGDVVNLAARLQSVAAADEVLVNDVLVRLAGPCATVVPTAPVVLKGKAEPVAVARVTALADGADVVGEPVAMVNRHVETALLRTADERARREGRIQLLTVLGPPGIGKSRLVREALSGSVARVVAGTFPSYGPGAGSAAVGQVVDALVRDSPECHGLVTSDQRLAAVLAGLGDQSRTDPAPPPPGAEEVAWAVREIFAAAAEPSLAVVWDGLEWAGPGFPELLSVLVDQLRDRAVLMVCVVRSLADAPWLRRLSGDVLELDSLSTADSAALAAAVLSGGGDVHGGADVELHEAGVVERACAHGAGNPLYIRLLLEGVSPGGPDFGVPPTITALVGSMIDRLPAAAQDLLGAASVVGVTFAAPEVEHLGVGVTAAGLDPLLDRRVITPTGHVGEYRFVQQIVHEVAYARLKKQWRLDRHRRLAEHGVGEAFHYEVAARLLGQLRPDDPGLPELERLASEALLVEGTTALRNRDGASAIALLERALELAAATDAHRAVAAIRLSDALLLDGHLGRAHEVVTAAGPCAPAPRSCLVQQQLLLLRAGSITGGAAESAVSALEAGPDDDLARCRAEQVRMLVHLGAGRFGAAELAARAALRFAQALRDPYEEDRLHVALCEVRQWSPAPIDEKLAGCAELAVRFAGQRYLLVPVLTSRARYLALTGDGDGAWAALAEASAAVDELRLATGRILVDQTAAVICRLDGRHATAETHFRRAADALEVAGFVRTALGLRAQAARQLFHSDPPAAVAELQHLLARRDEMDDAGRLVLLAAALAVGATGDGRGVTDGIVDEVHLLLEGNDDPCLRGEIYLDLARADRARGRVGAAGALVEAASTSFLGVGATRPMETFGAGS